MNELRTVMEKVGMNLTQKQMDDMLATAGGLYYFLIDLTKLTLSSLTNVPM